jgi:fused signal recognition particle receptor
LIGQLGRHFTKLREGLKRTRDAITDGVRDLVSRAPALDEEFWDGIEELLLKSDAGLTSSQEIVAELKKSKSRFSAENPEEVLRLLREIVARRMSSANARIDLQNAGRPAVILIVGVNGAGKTTTIAKLAHRWKEEGRKVLLAAADTYRAAAMEQLEVWAKRAGVPIVRGQEGQDSAAVVVDSIESAISRGADVVIIDTAGRLHTKSNLMDELRKIRRVLEKRIPGAPHETLLVLDATMGQNVIQQAKAFGESLGLTGLVLAKLDGTARGGAVLAIRRELNLPVKLVGVGEEIEDLQDFDPASFADALVSAEPEPPPR